MKENNPRNIVTQVLLLLLQIKCVSGCFFPYKIIKALSILHKYNTFREKKAFYFQKCHAVFNRDCFQNLVELN